MWKAKPHFCAVFCGVLALGAGMGSQARADNAPMSTYALSQALAAPDHVNLYGPQPGKGFNINSSYFSGYASGVAPPAGDGNFNDDQRLYALLVDGRYDFALDNSPITPHLSGGMGMASTLASANLVSSDSPMVPLFRLGGGVTYRLGAQWDMSLDYTAGHAALSGGDPIMTGGSQPADLQTLNVGMHYAF